MEVVNIPKTLIKFKDENWQEQEHVILLIHSFTS